MKEPTAPDDLPVLNVQRPGFSTKSPEVLAARDRHWCARTPFGLAVLRHRQAGLLLRDRRLRQGSYVWPDKIGLQGSFAQFWTRSVIGQEGAPHKALRRIAMKAFAPEWIDSLVPKFTRIANELAEALPSPCEFIADFTEPFAGRAITTLLGLPDEDAAALAHDASRLGLAMGVDGKSQEPIFDAATDRLMAHSRQLLARGSDQTSLVGRMIDAAPDADEQALLDLIVIAIFGGVDTTRAQLGFAAALFAQHPDQWDLLRAEPDLVPQAIEEVIRAWPTTTWSTREAIEDFTFDGVEITAGTTLHIWVHASATDPAALGDGSFDVKAERKIHFGFGGGAHHCLGQYVARTDMAAALRVLLARYRRIELAGKAEWLPDTGNTSPATLPLRFVN